MEVSQLVNLRLACEPLFLYIDFADEKVGKKREKHRMWRNHKKIPLLWQRKYIAILKLSFSKLLTSSEKISMQQSTKI
jgi:hypothetical protein